MKITLFTPHPALQRVFKTYFAQQGCLERNLVNALAAKGCGAMMVPFGQPASSHIMVSGFDNGGHIAQPTLCGPTSRSHDAFYAAGSFNVLYLVFQPTGVWHFARAHAGEMENRFYFPATLDLPVSLPEMQERLWGEFDPAAAVRLVEQYLLRAFSRRPAAWETDISPIAAYLHRRRGAVEVTELARKFRWSTRWLEKQFDRQVGMAPKLYARIVRFQALAAQLLQRPDTGWMQLVADFGYTDQSHLIKDFLRFSGRAPGHFFHPDQHMERNLLNGMH